MATTAASTTAERLDLGGHITGKRLAVVAGIVVAAIAVAIGVTAAVRSTDGQASWEKGLNARSDGLNRLYGLGAYSAGAAAAPASNAHNALRLRSEALNQKYGLGTFAVRVTPSAAWLAGHERAQRGTQRQVRRRHVDRHRVRPAADARTPRPGAQPRPADGSLSSAVALAGSVARLAALGDGGPRTAFSGGLA